MSLATDDNFQPRMPECGAGKHVNSVYTDDDDDKKKQPLGTLPSNLGASSISSAYEPIHTNNS